MFGSAATKNWIDPELSEELAKQRLETVSEKYGMDVEDVDVNFDPNIPYNVLGRTVDQGSHQEIKVGRRFVEASEYEQLETMAHEGFHVKQFRGDEIDWLQNEFGASDELSREVRKSWNSGDISEIEGITEVVVDHLMPFETSSGYPYEKRMKQNQLEARGIDVESELTQRIDNEIDRFVEGYKDVYSSFETDSLYVETGEIGAASYIGISYEEDPEQSINSYLAEKLTESPDIINGYQSSNPSVQYLEP